MGSGFTKVALVTGGSRGIGRASSIALARDGFELAFSYQRDERSAQEVAEIARQYGGTTRVYRADLSVSNDCEHLVSQVIADFGRLDVLVNNAAIAPATSIDEITVVEWDRVMNTNVRGAFLCARIALRQMRTQGGGRIIFISSQAGQSGGNFIGAHYVASKAALLGLSKSFAKAGAAHAVLVNCVVPGQIDTPLTSTFPGEKVRELTVQIPLKRMGTPEEVAEVIAFLASERASYLTGATIAVNGGLLML